MTAKDPVCGMTVEESDGRATSEYEGRRFYFCSNHCKEKFDRDPASYPS